MNDPTNADRAARIDAVIDAYQIATDGFTHEVEEDDVRDLLADLMHWCDRQNIDFEDNLRIAKNNYLEERMCL